MIVFPNCKINLGLRIGSKRPDGFHNLETIFFPIPLHDVLEIIPAGAGAVQPVTFTSSGFVVDGVAADNLCVKAYDLLRKDFDSLPPVYVHLHKAIPMGAGLGGGSADASFMLQLLNRKFNLGISEAALIGYALKLGSDCPFFIVNKPAYATSRGEILTPVELNLSHYQIVLINPGVHINTGWAFSQLNRSAGDNTAGQKSVKEIVLQPLETWREALVNDFEAPVFELHPQLQKIKEQLYKQGAVFAAMSGSGSTLFGLFDKHQTPELDLPPHYFVKQLPLELPAQAFQH